MLKKTELRHMERDVKTKKVVFIINKNNVNEVIRKEVLFKLIRQEFSMKV